MAKRLKDWLINIETRNSKQKSGPKLRQIVFGPGTKKRVLQFRHAGCKVKIRDGEEGVCMLQFCYIVPAFS
jgi:hypothetical protein